MSLNAFLHLFTITMMVTHGKRIQGDKRKGHEGVVSLDLADKKTVTDQFKDVALNGTDHAVDLAMGVPVTVSEARSLHNIPDFYVAYDISGLQYIRFKNIVNNRGSTDTVDLKWQTYTSQTPQAVPYVVHVRSLQPRKNPNWVKPAGCRKGLPDSSFMKPNVLCIQKPDAQSSDPCLYTIWRNKYNEAMYFIFKTSGAGKELVAQVTCERRKMKDADERLVSKISPFCSFYASPCPGVKNKENPLGRDVHNLFAWSEYDPDSRQFSFLFDPTQSRLDAVADHQVDIYLTFISAMPLLGWNSITAARDALDQEALDQKDLQGEQAADLAALGVSTVTLPQLLHAKAGQPQISVSYGNGQTYDILTFTGWTVSSAFWRTQSFSSPPRHPDSNFPSFVIRQLDPPAASALKWERPKSCSAAPNLHSLICVDTHQKACQYALWVTKQKAVYYVLEATATGHVITRWVHVLSTGGTHKLINFYAAQCPDKRSSSKPLGFDADDLETLMASFEPEKSGSLITVFKENQDAMVYAALCNALLRYGLQLPNDTDVMASVYEGRDLQ
eukprot:gnl/MRDRNA2_/MRDRNA2_147607_c0_seq1.p1 gnl/MRDRNA2_/MRDRNA2_147607_c0~~gnl/MRDRNA2_/MRDRNA2_147607_c0_seq1.p1  ORF type:complete len:558 (-),score=71.92 gnl/MRDRNA2_/MRDRNA2_147607_c0_seq1:60-1733(-)